MVDFLVRAGFVEGPGIRVRASCGKAGLTPHKQEGDSATPTGRLTLLRVLYRADRLRPPACAVPIEPIASHDAWCDDPAAPAYNRMIRLPHAARHESLWRQDQIYDVVGVLDWNLAPVIPGRGSAIFLHVARPDFSPTEGCVALALPDLLACLRAGLTAIVIPG